MATYSNPSEVWEALAAADKGEQRASILKSRHNRNLILNSGSFVIITSGNPDSHSKTLRDRLAPIRLLQTQRLRALKGAEPSFDGKGTFGGLSERTKPGEILNATIAITLSALDGEKIDEVLASALSQQLERLLALKDDLKIGEDGTIKIIRDMGEIARTTAARETLEEASELFAAFEAFAGKDIRQKLGIDSERLRDIFRASVLRPVPLAHVKDDNFVINIWNGDMNNPAFAVTPFGNLLDLDEESFDAIVIPGYAKMEEGRRLLANNPDQLAGREILGLEAVPLFDALKAWGKPGKNGGRDLSHDYRYPHEWLSVWHKAQIAFGLNQGAGGGPGYRETMMVSLIEEVQKSVIDEAEAAGEKPYNIDLIGALTIMNGGKLKDVSQLESFEEDFGLPHGTFVNMHNAAEDVMKRRGYKPTNPNPWLASSPSEAELHC